MVQYKTISEWHEAWQLPKPGHPLISAVKTDVALLLRTGDTMTSTCSFYCVAVKRVSGAEDIKLKYGRQPYDFNEGIMAFVSPGQVTSYTVEKDTEVRQSGWRLAIHPDLLWNTPLAGTIKNYEFWDYAVNESLFLSEKEEEVIIGIIQNIHRETHNNIDKFSKHIIISQLQSLLNYAERFYHRQFITREKINHQLLGRLDNILNDYFSSGHAAIKGLPTVNDIAASLYVSPKYLSSLLRALTGQNAQQHIHEKLISIAKEKIAGTQLSVSEIAYELGFEHVQSFTRLFKAKTSLSPIAFRQACKN